MTIKEKLAQIKGLFVKAQQFDTPTPPVPPVPTPPAPPAPPATQDYTLLDGSTITVSQLAVGGDVLVNGVPAPAGVYIMADNSSITVGDDGKITALTPAPAAPAPTVDMSTPQTMAEAVQKFATGTPEEQLANLWVVVTALFNNSFGWELRRAQEQANVTQAVSVMQQSMAAADITGIKASLTAQVEAGKLILELLDKDFKEPTGDVPEKKQSFAHLRKDTPMSAKDRILQMQQKAKAQKQNA